VIPPEAVTASLVLAVVKIKVSAFAPVPTSAVRPSVAKALLVSEPFVQAPSVN